MDGVDGVLPPGVRLLLASAKMAVRVLLAILGRESRSREYPKIVAHLFHNYSMLPV